MKKRILCVLLAVLLCGQIVSYSENQSEEKASSAPETQADAAGVTAPEAAVETEPEEETISPDLPDELDYGGETVHIVKIRLSSCPSSTRRS